MNVQVSSNVNTTLLMKDLNDGDLAVVTDLDSDYEGTVVHILYYSNLKLAISLGRKQGKLWADIGHNNLKVRKLNPGEILELS